MNSQYKSNEDIITEINKLVGEVQQLNIRVDNLSKQLKQVPKEETKEDRSFRIGQKVVIIHRNFRNQFGIEGTIFKITKHYIWLRDNNNKTYQKQKTKVVSLQSYESGEF